MTWSAVGQWTSPSNKQPPGVGRAGSPFAQRPAFAGSAAKSVRITEFQLSVLKEGGVLLDELFLLLGHIFEGMN
jgi:hypothetical protein